MKLKFFLVIALTLEGYLVLGRNTASSKTPISNTRNTSSKQPSHKAHNATTHTAGGPYATSPTLSHKNNSSTPLTIRNTTISGNTNYTLRSTNTTQSSARNLSVTFLPKQTPTAEDFKSRNGQTSEHWIMPTAPSKPNNVTNASSAQRNATQATAPSATVGWQAPPNRATYNPAQSNRRAGIETEASEHWITPTAPSKPNNIANVSFAQRNASQATASSAAGGWQAPPNRATYNPAQSNKRTGIETEASGQWNTPPAFPPSSTGMRSEQWNTPQASAPTGGWQSPSGTNSNPPQIKSQSPSILGTVATAMAIPVSALAVYGAVSALSGGKKTAEVEVSTTMKYEPVIRNIPEGTRTVIEPINPETLTPQTENPELSKDRNLLPEDSNGTYAPIAVRMENINTPHQNETSEAPVILRSRGVHRRTGSDTMPATGDSVNMNANRYLMWSTQFVLLLLTTLSVRGIVQ